MAKSKNAIEVPLDKIVPDPDQPREEFEPESLERLAESLKTRGQLQPIRVRWDEAQGKYVLICGERRWRAARIAGIATMSCVVSEGPIDAGELLALQLVENCLREDLRPIEQAKAFKSLMDRNGWSGNQAAKALGIAQPTVVRALALLDLPEPVQDQVEQGTLAARDRLRDRQGRRSRAPAGDRRPRGLRAAEPRRDDRGRPRPRPSVRLRSRARAGGRARPERLRPPGRSKPPGARSPSNTARAWTTTSLPRRSARPSTRSKHGGSRPPERNAPLVLRSLMAAQLRHRRIPALARPFRLLALQQRERHRPEAARGPPPRGPPAPAGRRPRTPDPAGRPVPDAIRNGATMHEVREFAGQADIRTTELYFERKEEDAEVAARRIQIRLTGSRSQ